MNANTSPSIEARREQIAGITSTAHLPLVNLAESYGAACGHAAYDKRTGELPKVVGTHGKIEAAAACLTEAAAAILSARGKCLADKRVISDAELTRIEREMALIQSALALLEGQLTEAREDRFSHQDAVA